MPPRRKPTAAKKDIVPSTESMGAQVFRLHCQKRHPRLGFWSKGEHAADHRLHAETLDHTHAEPEAPAPDETAGKDET